MNDVIVNAGRFMGLSSSHWNVDNVQVESVCPDGSLRIFHRLIGVDNETVIVVQPPAGDRAGLLEAKLTWEIGRHLHCQGVPVPEIYGFEEKNGQLFMEDLADTRLYDFVAGASGEAILSAYKKVIKELVVMQVRGVDGMSKNISTYDISLMLEKESGYFIEALCTDLLETSWSCQQVGGELRLIAEQAGKAPNRFFLHRDFQSRNIMIKDDEIRIIDFQGGLFGPLGYDLASLLIDPYVQLSHGLQEQLLDFYIQELQNQISYDANQFRYEFVMLSLQRNLQILGAFAFLSSKRDKPFFAQFIKPALSSLEALLAKTECADFAGLRKLVASCLHRLPALN
jgi:hypothetical protein